MNFLVKLLLMGPRHKFTFASVTFWLAAVALLFTKHVALSGVGTLLSIICLALAWIMAEHIR